MKTCVEIDKMGFLGSWHLFANISLIHYMRELDKQCIHYFKIFTIIFYNIVAVANWTHLKKNHQEIWYSNHSIF